MPFSDYRKYFPITTQKIYLNHAAISPLSTRVTDKMDLYLDERSFGSVDIYQQVIDVREDARQMVAKLINVQAEQIAFITNTSEGFNCLVNGLTWKDGDQIILTDYEFPSNVYPFKNLERYGVEILYVPNRNGQIYIEDIEQMISPHTKLLSISFVEFSNGFRNDLEVIGGLCQKHDIIFSVDSIQGLGAIPLDAEKCKIDFLSNGGHKWLMAPMGTGFMYLQPELFRKIVPAYTGWLAVEDPWNFFDYKLDLLSDARRFEYATANFLGITGLSASLELLLEGGIEQIEKHILNLGDHLIQGFRNQGLKFMGAENKRCWSGIYSFSGINIEELFNYLTKNNIICSLRNGMLRISPHFYNTIEEINELIQHIKQFYNS